MINFEDFAKVELKVGKILTCEPVEGSEKLLKLQVNFGEKDETGLPAGRQVLSGIAKWYSPQDLVGKSFIFVTNLEVRQMMGLESCGMILATDTEKPILIKPATKVKPGTILR